MLDNPKVLDQHGILVLRPVPSGKIPPGTFGFEEGGVVIYYSALEDLQKCPHRIDEKWFKVHHNRYIRGVPT